MADIVAVLSTCWKLISAINEVVTRIEQTREDARALSFLERQARSFLDIVNEGLIGVDASPYLGTIVSLEGLLKAILTATNEYIKMSTVARLWNINRTKSTILNLNKRLRLFVDTYLLQTTTQAARVNLEAFSNPVPAVNLDQPTLIPDDVRWEIMTHSGTAETAVDPRGRIVSWARDVREGHLDDTQPDGVITTEPSRRSPPVIPTIEQLQVKEPDIYQNRFVACCHVWKNETCPCIYRSAICAPIRAPVCVADCIGRFCLVCRSAGDVPTAISGHPQDPGCCTTCVFKHFPLCMPDMCMTEGGMGVFCADSCWKGWHQENPFDRVICFPVYILVWGSRAVMDRWRMFDSVTRST